MLTLGSARAHFVLHRHMQITKSSSIEFASGQAIIVSTVADPWLQKANSVDMLCSEIFTFLDWQRSWSLLHLRALEGPDSLRSWMVLQVCKSSTNANRIRVQIKWIYQWFFLECCFENDRVENTCIYQDKKKGRTWRSFYKSRRKAHVYYEEWVPSRGFVCPASEAGIRWISFFCLLMRSTLMYFFLNEQFDTLWCSLRALEVNISFI